MRTLTVPAFVDALVAQAERNPHRAVFAWGPPGTGKTAGIHQAAERLHANVIDVRLGTLVPSDLRGVPVPDRERRTTDWYPGSFLPDPERDGPTGILALDEYVQAPPSLQALAQRLVLERRLGDDYRLPDGWLVVAAGNRQSDRAATLPMPRQTQNRFKHYLILPELTAFLAYAEARDFHPHLRAFLHANPELLHRPSDDDAEPAWPSPRTWEIADEDYRATLDPDELHASVGVRAATLFRAFTEALARLPDPHAIATGRAADAQLPSDHGDRYALLLLLASHAVDAEHAARALAFVRERGLDAEQQRAFTEMLAARAQREGWTAALAAALGRP
jgi:MoxR-like ATPase